MRLPLMYGYSNSFGHSFTMLRQTPRWTHVCAVRRRFSSCICLVWTLQVTRIDRIPRYAPSQVS